MTTALRIAALAAAAIIGSVSAITTAEAQVRRPAVQPIKPVTTLRAAPAVRPAPALVNRAAAPTLIRPGAGAGIVAAGGGNIVAAGGGNIVAGGAGNFRPR